jgi:hypothetical protein
LKKKYKQNYLNIRETSKILINIATSEYIRENPMEAIKFYEHALAVINNTSKEKSVGGFTIDPEAAKIYLSMAHIQ